MIEKSAEMSAHGNCVLTWAMRSQPAAIAEMIVVSEMGDAWSPKTPPEMTAAIARGRRVVVSASILAAIVMAIGIIIEKVPQLVPVEKAMMAERRKIPTGKRAGWRMALAKCEM